MARFRARPGSLNSPACRDQERARTALQTSRSVASISAARLASLGLSPRRHGSVTRMVNAGVQDKILYGDDLPWFNPHYGIGCVLFSRISDEARHAILHENAERVFERWL